jgi:hypothetical protein
MRHRFDCQTRFGVASSIDLDWNFLLSCLSESYRVQFEKDLGNELCRSRSMFDAIPFHLLVDLWPPIPGTEEKGFPFGCLCQKEERLTAFRQRKSTNTTQWRDSSCGGKRPWSIVSLVSLSLLHFTEQAWTDDGGWLVRSWRPNAHDFSALDHPGKSSWKDFMHQTTSLVR